MRDKATAYIRTLVPILVGSFLAWLASKGLNLNDAQDLFIYAMTAGFQGIYYVAARLIGRRFPKAEAFLLGSEKTPVYI